MDTVIETGDSKKEYRFTRIRDSFSEGNSHEDMLEIKFLWGIPGHERSTKTCTYFEALEIRDALNDLFPPEDDFVDVDLFPAYDVIEEDGKWHVTYQEHSFAEIVVRGTFNDLVDAVTFQNHLEETADLDIELTEDDVSKAEDLNFQADLENLFHEFDTPLEIKNDDDAAIDWDKVFNRHQEHPEQAD